MRAVGVVVVAVAMVVLLTSCEDDKKTADAPVLGGALPPGMTEAQLLGTWGAADPEASLYKLRLAEADDKQTGAKGLRMDEFFYRHYYAATKMQASPVILVPVEINAYLKVCRETRGVAHCDYRKCEITPDGLKLSDMDRALLREALAGGKLKGQIMKNGLVFPEDLLITDTDENIIAFIKATPKLYPVGMSFKKAEGLTPAEAQLAAACDVKVIPPAR
ncbi:MAG: hypothetical protein NTW87_25195 [Planctomycetota bacterium]|nr:hypothetical protein [Planctomycetota bacterium]